MLFFSFLYSNFEYISRKDIDNSYKLERIVIIFLIRIKRESCYFNFVDMQASRLFTCPECGHAFPVKESSAGETLLCPGCQKTITLPSLGTLRDLPIQQDLSEAPVKGQTVTALDRRVGVMILLGAIAFVFLILAAVWGYRYYISYTSINAIEYEQWNVIQTWTQWQFLRPGVDTPLTETEQINFYYLRMLWKWLVIYLSIASVCILGIVVLWIVPIRNENESMKTKQ